MTDRVEYQALTQRGAAELLAYPTIKRGLPQHVHKAIVIQYILWYGLSTDVFLSRVSKSHSDYVPVRAREWDHYLKAIGALR